MNEYNTFLESKRFEDINSGFEPDEGLYPSHGEYRPFPFQKSIIDWAVRRGRAAIFADTGLGKTPMQLIWAWIVHQHTGNRVLIFAPLCVAHQTVREGAKFGVPVKYVRSFDELRIGPNAYDTGIFITNYEMVDHFEQGIKACFFDGIVLDESSILKSIDGKTRKRLIELCREIPHRLSCTATPSPNDHMELGNQAEFLGIMSMAEMLAMFFTHDGGQTSKWVLKGHGKTKFWEWLSTWGVAIKKPSDLGFSDEGYDLPPLNHHEHCIESGMLLDGELFPHVAQSLSERITARRRTVDIRVARAAEIANGMSGKVLVWCHRNDESEKLTKAIDGAVEVRGSHKSEDKENRVMGFVNGDIRVLITKPSIAGFGLNLQICNQTIFVGLNDSFEQLYQATRRFWRFGQENPVDVHIITADIEGAVLENIKRKERQAQELSGAMVEYMRDFTRRKISSLKRDVTVYEPNMDIIIPGWING